MSMCLLASLTSSAMDYPCLPTSAANSSSPSLNSTAATLPPFLELDCYASSPEGIYLWVGVELLTCALGLPTNLLLLWTHLRHPPPAATASPSPSTLPSSSLSPFVLSLTCMDLLFCLVAPLDAVNYLSLSSTTLYNIIYFFLGFNEVGGPLLLGFLCLDRYLAVVWPLVFLRLRARRWWRPALVLLWGVSLAYCTFSACTQWQYFYEVAMVLYPPVLLLGVFCNLSILRVLRMGGPGKEGMGPAKQRAFTVVSRALVIMLFSYTPTLVAVGLKPHVSSVVFYCYVSMVASAAVAISSCIQPLTYLYSMGKLPGGGASRE